VGKTKESFTGGEMSEKPCNVDAEGEEVWVKGHLTHFWQDGVRHPIIKLLNEKGEVDYSAGVPGTPPRAIWRREG
jgi:hypothetical protein